MKDPKKIPMPLSDAPQDAPEVDISEEAFAELQASLDKTEHMKHTVAEAIVRAKEKELTPQVARLRVLLRKLFAMEAILRREQTRKEIVKLTAELNALEAEYTAELLHPEESESIGKDAGDGCCYAKKATRRECAAKFFGYLGAVLGLFGCIAYLILTREDMLGLPFSWGYVAICGGVLVLFTVIALLFHASARVNASLAEALQEQHLAWETETAALLEAEEAEATAKAFALELEKTVQATEVPAEEEEGKCCCLKKLKQSATPEGLTVSVKTNPKALAAVAVIGVVAVITASLAGKRKKTKQATTPKIHGIRLEWGN